MTSGSIDARCLAVTSSTSAPCAASVRPQTGPAMMRVRSSTFTPDSGRSRRGEFSRWRIADLLDAEQRQLRHRLALRMAIPLRERAARGDDETGFGGRGLERLGRHAVERALHRGLVVRHAKELEEPAAMMRQIGVQPREAAVAAAIKPGEVVVIFVGPFAVDAQITLAAEFDCRMAHIDADVLAAAGAQPPQLRRCQRRSADGRLRRRPDSKRRRQHRLGAGELHLAERRVVVTGAAPELGEYSFGIGRRHFFASQSARPRHSTGPVDTNQAGRRGGPAILPAAASYAFYRATKPAIGRNTPSER